MLTLPVKGVTTHIKNLTTRLLKPRRHNVKYLAENNFYMLS